MRSVEPFSMMSGSFDRIEIQRYVFGRGRDCRDRYRCSGVIAAASLRSAGIAQQPVADDAGDDESDCQGDGFSTRHACFLGNGVAQTVGANDPGRLTRDQARR